MPGIILAFHPGLVFILRPRVNRVPSSAIWSSKGGKWWDSLSYLELPHLPMGSRFLSGFPPRSFSTPSGSSASGRRVFWGMWNGMIFLVSTTGKKHQRYWILNRKLETSKEEDKTQRGSIGSIGSIVLAEIEFRNPFVWRRHHCSVFGPEAPSTFVS